MTIQWASAPASRKRTAASTMGSAMNTQPIPLPPVRAVRTTTSRVSPASSSGSEPHGSTRLRLLSGSPERRDVDHGQAHAIAVSRSWLRPGPPSVDVEASAVHEELTGDHQPDQEPDEADATVRHLRPARSRGAPSRSMGFERVRDRDDQRSNRQRAHTDQGCEVALARPHDREAQERDDEPPDTGDL